MAAETRTWIGDRQKYLVYDIPGTSDENDIEYHDGDFYERGNGQSVRSERLFFGITILQFKNSVKKEKPDMTECLRNCQKQICALVKNSGLDVQCSVFGTLGSSGLTIFWLADQYTDVLKLVTEIRSKNVVEDIKEDKSAFLSAYTIFAQNHEYGDEWSKKIAEVQGNALLRLTLKRGLNQDIKEEIFNLIGDDVSTPVEICHCAGEHDVIVKIKSSKVYDLFGNDGKLHFKTPFFEKYVFQTNIQLYEDIYDFDGLQQGISAELPQSRESEAEDKDFKQIQDEYEKLRKQFEGMFPSTAGMVLGTPVCQYRYSGQNNLSLYAFFGVIKEVLQYVYKLQSVTVQDEIIPLIVADIVPLIESRLYLNYMGKMDVEGRDDTKIITVTIPMVSLYNPVGYYPYLYHEIFHYVVPKDRYIRNQMLGCLFSAEIIWMRM